MKNGSVDKVIYQLEKNPGNIKYEVFHDIEPEPGMETVKNGAERMRKFEPDCLIA